VVGHEFSYILNSDMRLIALLAGTMMISQTGLFLARAGFYSGPVRARRDSRGQFALGTLGVVLVVIGYIGVFYNQLIQAVVSMLKPAVTDASAECVSQNSHTSVREYETMRLVADQLDCPIPPLID